MNRPNLDDYKSLDKCKQGWQLKLEFVKYRLDLEKYCDELEKENKQLKEDYEVQKQYFADVLNETKQDLEKARDTLIKERNLITRLYKQLEGLTDGK